MFLKEMEIPKKTWLRGDHLNNQKDSNVDKDIDDNLNDGVIEEVIILFLFKTHIYYSWCTVNLFFLFFKILSPARHYDA